MPKGALYALCSWNYVRLLRKEVMKTQGTSQFSNIFIWGKAVHVFQIRVFVKAGPLFICCR